MGQKSGPAKLPAEQVVKAIRRATRRSRLFPQRSPPRLFTVAACGSLKPAPDGQLRGAYPHLLCSSALPLLVVRSRRTLIQIPFVADPREPTTDPIRELLAKFARPLPQGFVADDDAASGQQLLHHAKTEREAEIQPHGNWKGRIRGFLDLDQGI